MLPATQGLPAARRPIALGSASVPLLKRRPGIRLTVPQTIAAGTPFRACAVLRCKEPVPVDAVTVELLCTSVWDDQGVRELQTLARHVARPLLDPTELPAGEHELAVAFALPAHVPGSYTGRHLSVRWSMRVHVDIPWWPDARATFLVFVQSHSAQERAAPMAQVFATSTSGPVGRRPYAEASLGSTLVEPGGVVRGRVALSNTAYNQYRALRLSLVAIETATSIAVRTMHDVVRRWTVPLTAAQDDVPIELALQLPTGLIPGFVSGGVELSWALEIRIDTAWAIDTKLWIPLEVRATGGSSAEEVAVPQSVGAERLAKVWTVAARHVGWSYAGDALTQRLADCRLEIRREHRGRRGLRLRGELSFGDLDLGLRLERGRLRCRDAGQGRVLAEHTDPWAADLEISHVDDQRIVCALGDSGFRIGPVVELAQRLEAFARALVTAREQLPAPADMVDAVPWFRAAARRLGAELELASMDIRGVRDELRFSLQTQWDEDGTLARTVIEARPTLPVDGRWHQRWSGVGEPGPMPEGLAALVPGAKGLIVDEGSIQLEFPACREDPEPLVGRLEALLELARRLSGRGLGYR